jgi:hypothetical protein
MHLFQNKLKFSRCKLDFPFLFFFGAFFTWAETETFSYKQNVSEIK